MSASTAVAAPSHDLPLLQGGVGSAPAGVEPAIGKRRSFPAQLLARNAVWLCRLRWGAVGILVVFGVSALLTDRIAFLGLLLRSDWPLIMAVFLAGANALFALHARRLVAAGTGGGARLNIWGQMVVDLVAHTFVVHFLGSLETYALFVYIFHIFLACLFFSRLESLVVVALACFLFTVCFALEATGLAAPTSVYVFKRPSSNGPAFSRAAAEPGANCPACQSAPLERAVLKRPSSNGPAFSRPPVIRNGAEPGAGCPACQSALLERAVLKRASAPSILNAASAMAIWLVVWYLASSLAGLVRQRDAELVETNRRLVVAQEEKARHLLRTTHELKAPFAAIHANAQLLLKGHCGPFTEEAHGVLQRISRRCRRLAREIQEMLQLANLRSAAEAPPPQELLDLAAVVRASLAHIRPQAEERKVEVEERLCPARVFVVEEHLRMLLDNLLSNAVLYSHEGRVVHIGCVERPDGGATLTVEDHGIGILEEKLPRIFDEYYRTDEAARFNKESTGLGLTIVRHVAQAAGIRVRVESRLGEGTKFTLRFPPVVSGASNGRR